MKKLSFIISGIILLLIFPSQSDAASLNLSFSCSNVTVGQSTTCVLRGTSDVYVTGIEASISITGATIESVTNGSGFGPMENSPSRIAYYGIGAGNTGTFTIATFNIKTSTVGSATISASGIQVVGGDDQFSAPSTRASFRINEKPTAAPPPQTKPTTRPQVNPNTTTTTVRPTEPVGTELKLDSIKVGDYEVTYQDGKYYATVDFDTENISVDVTANPNLTIIGGGLRTLAVGKNVVEIILRNELNQSATIQVIITRPEDTNNYSAYLTELKVVDYDFSFDKDTLEYTINVPTFVKELYVIAKTDDENLTIMGDGLHSLENGDNEIHVKVQYGNKVETNYVIHVKRNYNSIIMWGVIAMLSLAEIITILIFSHKLKTKSVVSKEEKNKILADANRAIAESKENVSVNGQSVVTPGQVGVSPIQNVVPNANPAPANINVNEPVKKTENVGVQVAAKRIPTNPVAVATSTVDNPKNSISNQQNNVQTNVKVVRTLDRQPIRVNRTNGKPNVVKQVVVKTGKQN